MRVEFQRRGKVITIAPAPCPKLCHAWYIDLLHSQVRGYRLVKKGLSRRLTDIEHERRRAKSEVPFISTSGVSASYLSNGHEYWQPMDPIYYHEKSCCFRNTYSRCPIFKNRVTIGRTEPRLDLFKNELPPVTIG